MSTMPRASFHEQSRRGLFIFLALFYLLGTGTHLSWGQEVVDHGPAPESVLELNSPLDIPFLPLAPFPLAFTALRDSLREPEAPAGTPAAFLPRYPGGIESTHVLFQPRQSRGTAQVGQ